MKPSRRSCFIECQRTAAILQRLSPARIRQLRHLLGRQHQLFFRHPNCGRILVTADLARCQIPVPRCLFELLHLLEKLQRRRIAAAAAAFPVAVLRAFRADLCSSLRFGERHERPTTPRHLSRQVRHPLSNAIQHRSGFLFRRRPDAIAGLSAEARILRAVPVGNLCFDVPCRNVIPQPKFKHALDKFLVATGANHHGTLRETPVGRSIRWRDAAYD